MQVQRVNVVDADRATWAKPAQGKDFRATLALEPASMLAARRFRKTRSCAHSEQRSECALAVSEQREGRMMRGVLARLAVASLIVAGVAAEAKACYPEGDWYHTTASGEVQKLTLSNEGTFAFAGTKGTWKAEGGRMAGTLAVTTNGGDGDVASTY